MGKVATLEPGDASTGQIVINTLKRSVENLETAIDQMWFDTNAQYSLVVYYKILVHITSFHM